jgi:opacity protein-like surface antigen
MIGNFFDKKGNLPYTKEPTEISLITFGGGVKFRLTTDPLSIYLGGGPALCSYKESNPIGVARGNGLGFIGQLGLYFRIVGGLIIDIAADYTSFKVKPKTIKADLGGAKAGIRIGYVF